MSTLHYASDPRFRRPAVPEDVARGLERLDHSLARHSARPSQRPGRRPMAKSVTPARADLLVGLARSVMPDDRGRVIVEKDLRRCAGQQFPVILGHNIAADDITDQQIATGVTWWDHAGLHVMAEGEHLAEAVGDWRGLSVHGEWAGYGPTNTRRSPFEPPQYGLRDFELRAIAVVEDPGDRRAVFTIQSAGTEIARATKRACMTLAAYAL